MSESPATTPRNSLVNRLLNAIEWAGNKLPDPALLFLFALLLTWGLSAVLSNVAFDDLDPRTVNRKDKDGRPLEPVPIQVHNQLAPTALVRFLSEMVTTFTSFPPLGVVLVALLGVGIAEHTGWINALLKGMLNVTPRQLLTPMVLTVAIVSHTAGDTGYVLVIPLGGVMFAAAGRHPVAGIVTAFAGVAGGFSANFVPSGLDPLLQGFTQTAAQIIDPNRQVNPLCNFFFTGCSSLLIISLGWFITDRIIEPRLRATPVDGDPAEMPKLEEPSPAEKRGMIAGLVALGIGLVLLVVAAAWPDSAFQGRDGSLAAHDSPLMRSIVPLIFILFLIPGVVHGYVAGTVKSHRDIVKGMSKSMSTMGYYLVMAFAAAQFTFAFRESNLGALLAIKGAALLQALSLPPAVTILGIIALTTAVNLLIGSASAKWALLAPIFVPMLMQAGLSPELTQAAYRVGDSSTNIITPLLPYFPLIVVYCQRYVKNTGIGTLVALMAPYSLTFLIGWSLFLLAYWHLGIPLGLQASYEYPAPVAP